MQALFLLSKVENYIMIACEKKEKKEIPPNKMVVVCTYILNFLPH